MVLFTVLIAGGTARADSDPVKAAKRLFMQGKQHYSKGRYFKSLDQFQQALKQSPRPVILLNIAQCYRKLKLPPRALFFYEWYLTEWRKRRPDRPPKFLAEVTGHIQQRKRLITAYRRGEEQFRDKKYAQALASFQAAQKILPWTRIHINVARCHFKLGRPAMARAHAKLALKRFRRQLAAWQLAVGGGKPDQAEVRSKIQLLETLLRGRKKPPAAARLVITGLPRGAKIFLRDKLRGTTPGAAELSLPPGKYPLRVELGGHLPWRRTLTLKPGARLEQRVLLQPVVVADSRPGRSTLLLSSGISAAALAAGAEVMALVFLVQANDLYLDDPTFVDYQNYVIAGHITAGCMAAASAVLFYFYVRSGDRDKKSGGRSATFQVGPSRGGGMVGTVVPF